MEDICKFIGDQTLTIKEVMERINENANRILFLTDDNKVLIASITDGDVRRYLLAGGKIDEAAINTANKNPRCAKSTEEAKKTYHAQNYTVIPIVDDAGVIIDVFLGNAGGKSKKRKNIGIPVVINAGGKGERLDPLTKVLPKPLIPIGDIPIIEHVMKEFISYGCSDFHIIVNYKRDLIKAYFSDNDDGYRITWHDEFVPLGTGGGLTLLRHELNGPFFFVNCDVLLTADYGSIYRFHKENGNAITMVCANKKISLPYGIIEMDEYGGIKDMKEKPTMSFLTNTGVYLAEHDIIDDMEDDVPVSFPDVIFREKQLGRKVAVFPVEEDQWMDMGQFPELERMRIKMYGE